MAEENLVLVVEDDSPIRNLFVESIDPDKFTVITAGSGAEARDLLTKNGDEVHVVVLDIDLPGEDSIELFSELGNLCPDAEVAVISGDENTAKAALALKMGAFDVLETPFIPLEAVQTIRNGVERKRLRQLNAELSATKRTLETELTLKSFQIDQVRELINFSRLINEQLRLDAILDIAYERLPELINAETFSLFLYRPESREFQLAITNRPNLDPREQIVVKEDDSPIMQRALRMHRVLFIDDVSSSELMPHRDSDQRPYKKAHSVCLPLKVEDRPIGVLNLNDFRSDEQIEEYINTAVLAAAFLAPVISNSILYSKIEEAANHDGLTQLYNRSFFDRSLHENFRRSKRYGRPLSLLFMDIDHFKQFNDVHGHQIGDAVLQKVAKRLSANMRQDIDIVARFGGEEMVLIAPETARDGIEIVSDRLRRDIEATKVVFYTESEKKVLSVTVSIGTATFNPETVPAFESERELIEAADEAMYHAKRNGRNRCMHLDAPDLERIRAAEKEGV